MGCVPDRQGWITCFQCGREVNRVRAGQNPDTSTGDGPGTERRGAASDASQPAEGGHRVVQGPTGTWGGELETQTGYWWRHLRTPC